MSDKASPVFNQLNIVSGNTEASLRFYRKLGIEIPDRAIWKTQSGAHHITAQKFSESEAADLDIDSTAFARVWNGGWKDREGLAGRVVIGFEVSSREGIDALYAEMTGAGYRGLQPPYDALWGRGMLSSKTRTGSQSDR
ncbi:MAG TPA: VOC family protein [Rhizomicrobium sp.]|jgi:uncharacterized glyoxalase superfamily protein PhnB